MVPDTFSRPLRNLRVSVTDRCNLRCQYCMPEKDYVWLPRQDILDFEELRSLVDVFAALGVDKIRLTGGEELRVRGRLDLILSRDERADQIWIVDYKTGEAKPLRSGARELRKQLIAGEGVQICIYALALRDDFVDICASLLTREADLERQVSLDDIVAANELWEEIVRMEESGIFGMLGEIRSEFTFTGDYPLATLSIDQFLLRDKWEHTHPAFAKDQGK